MNRYTHPNYIILRNLYDIYKNLLNLNDKLEKIDENSDYSSEEIRDDEYYEIINTIIALLDQLISTKDYINKMFYPLVRKIFLSTPENIYGKRIKKLVIYFIKLTKISNIYEFGNLLLDTLDLITKYEYKFTFVTRILTSLDHNDLLRISFVLSLPIIKDFQNEYKKVYDDILLRRSMYNRSYS